MKESFTSSEPQRTSLMSTSVQRNRQWKVWKVDGESLMDVTLMKVRKTSFVSNGNYIIKYKFTIALKHCCDMTIQLFTNPYIIADATALSKDKQFLL